MILVTGASGLVGSHLVARLVKEGRAVRALYRNAIPAIEGAAQVDWVKGDILDVVALEEAMDGVQQVYHCAAIVSFHPRKKAAMHKTNVEGTANVVNACLSAGVQKLLFVSSVAALGRIREDRKINETMNWSEETSNSEYGKTKFLAEMEVWRGIGEGLNAVIVNPVIILGAGDWTKGSSELFKSAYNEFPWYTEGVSGFVDVEDVVRAMTLLMKTDNIHSERFILCGENLPYKEVFTLIANNFNKKPPHRKVTPLIAGLVWRWEAFKSMFSGKDPMLTKETAKTAAAKVYFDNNKIQRYFLNFEYTPVRRAVHRICGELQKRHNL
jgi:dihydroflavonol-4-reductase